MDAPPSSPPQPKRSTWRSVAIAGTCTAAMLVNSSNNTSVAIALPTIGAALHARAAALQWLVSAYPLSSGCLLLFCGHIADVHGRKRVFVGGSAILAAFTLACGFVHDEVTLAVLRGLQGIGGAATIPAALGILAHEFPPSSGRARAAAFSSFSAGAPVGGALGMVLGGLVTQLSRYTWRAQFFLSAAIAFATLVVGVLVIPPDAPLLNSASPSDNLPPVSAPTASSPDAHTYPPETKDASSAPPPSFAQRDTRTDWPGAILSAAGLILLVFVLGQGSGPGLPPPRMSDGAMNTFSFPPSNGSVFPRGEVPFILEGGEEIQLDADGEKADAQPSWGGMKDHRHPPHPHHHHHHPPPPPRGFFGWLFGGRPPPPRHHHHHHPPPPHLPHGPHRRSPPEDRSDSTFWRVQSESEAFEVDVDLDLELDADWEQEDMGIDTDPHAPHHEHPHHHGPHASPDDDESHVGEHAHHHHHPRPHGPHPLDEESHGGKYAHHHGPHAHHGPHHHGPGHGHRHRHGPPPPGGFRVLLGWLTGRPPRPPHRHGPRHPSPMPSPNGPGGGPPWGGEMPHHPEMRGDEAWGMAYIISLLLLSLILLALFAIWEFHLERVHSRPGGALYDASKHAGTHARDATDDTAADVDAPRRSSVSSASRPPTRKPATVPGLIACLVNMVKSNRFFKAAKAYTPPPLLPPSLFARRRGRVGFVYGIALLQFGAFMVWAFWVQLYYQVYIGYSPVRTVVRLTPMFVTGIICNVVVALIVGRVPTLWLLASGTLTTTVAPLLFALIIPSAPYWAFGFPAAVCSVVGADFLFAAGTMFVSDSVGPGEQSVAGGVFQTMTQLGTSFGVTASTIVFNHVQQGATRTGADALASYHAAMWMGVGFGGVATLFALLAFRGIGISNKQVSPVEKNAVVAAQP